MKLLGRCLIAVAVFVTTACEPHELVWWSTQADEIPQEAYDEGCAYDFVGCVDAHGKLETAMTTAGWEPPVTTTTTTTTVPVVGVTYHIAIPDTPPDGVCAPEWTDYKWAGDAYEWENCWTASSVTINDRITASDAESLLMRIWADVVVEGKLSTPPTMHTNDVYPDAADCNCTAWYSIGDHSLHFKDDWPVRAMAFLHETAHALTTNHPTHEECSLILSTNRSECRHGDIFRCTAEFLYAHYLNVSATGGCGKDTTRETPTTTTTTMPQSKP